MKLALAKPDLSLIDHTSGVVEAFIYLFSDGPFVRKFFKFFRMDFSYYPQFYRNGLLACALHDIAKANSDFQEMMQCLNQGDMNWSLRERQAIHHSHLAPLMFMNPEIQQWINSIPDIDGEIVLSAVLCHHLKANPEHYTESQSNRKTWKLWIHSVNEVLAYASNLFKVSPPQHTLATDWKHSPQELKKVKSRCNKFNEKLRKDPIRSKLLLMVKVAVILADASSSAMSRTKKPLSWLQCITNPQQLTSQYIWDNIIEPKKKDIASEFNAIQEEMRLNGVNRQLLIASCGGGKTLAAYLWAATMAGIGNVSRLIFLYPTKATTNAGFEDYLCSGESGDVALLHQDADYEIEAMIKEWQLEGDDRGNGAFNHDKEMFYLGYWQRKIFNSTIDQFFSFIEHGYGSLCLLPLLIDSVVVIDEVHSLDNRLWQALKRFLREFDVPVLCMTATLSNQKRKELEECGLRCFPNTKKELDRISEDAKIPRYLVKKVRIEDVLQIALDAMSTKKVLWVVNTVARCQEIARQFNALCYHSRFKVIDRKNIHKCVIEIFRKDSTEPVIVITTQVCEMSLDLNADVLITELAPIASMSQRMGRCNRFAHIFRDGRLGQVYVYYPPNYPQKTNPYEKLDFQGAEQFVDDLNGKIVSQYDLQELLEKYSANRPVPLQSLSLWESGPWAYPQSLRDISQTVPALMPEDVELYKLLKSQKRHANELLIPALGYTIEVKDKLAIVKQQYSYSPKYGLS